MRFLLLSFLLLLTNCSTPYLSVMKLSIDETSFASFYVDTPDINRCQGKKADCLFIKWILPQSLFMKSPYLLVDVIDCTYQYRTLTYPIISRFGYETYSVFDIDKIENRPILSYRVFLCSSDGDIHACCQHQLWVELIKFDEEIEPMSP